MRYRNLLFLSLVAILLAACADSPPPSGDLNPVVDDPEMEINVTTQPEEKYALFTLVVTRVGTQAPKIGWSASGEIYLKVTLGVDSPLNVMGTGFGTAGFDASSQICKDQGGWPIEYTAEGYFNEKDCELTLLVTETWPQTEAFSICQGVSGSASGGVYKLSFPSLKFTDDNPRVDNTTSADMLTWVNSFQLYPKEGLKGTGCLFEEE